MKGNGTAIFSVKRAKKQLMTVLEIKYVTTRKLLIQNLIEETKPVAFWGK